MEWLTLWFALQVGLSPNSLMVTYSPEISAKYWQDTMYTELTAEVRLFNKILSIGGSVRTEIIQERWCLNFLPEMSAYSFFAKLKLGLIEVGYSRACQHATVPYAAVYRPILNWEGAYNELYIEFSGDVKL